MVEELALLRRMIGAAGEVAEMGYRRPDDVAETLDRAESLIFQVADRRITDTTRPAHDLAADLATWRPRNAKGMHRTRKRAILTAVELPDNPVPDDDLVDFVNSTGAASDSLHGIGSRLMVRERETGDLKTGWVGTAFDYPLARRVGRNRQGPPFGAQSQIGGQTYPIPVDDVPDVVVDLWERVMDRAVSAAVLARLGHLLFTRGRNPGRNGRLAAAAYLELGTGGWSRLDRVNCLHWSLELSRRLNDVAGVEGVIPHLVALADLSLDQEQSEPGVALHALEVLAHEDPTNPRLPDLLDRARKAYPDPFLTGETIRLQSLVFKGDEQRRTELRREEVESYLDHAEKHSGLMRMVFLEDAAKLASRHGLSDLVATATARMQAMTIKDLDLKSIGVSMSLPVQDVEDHINRVLGAPTIGHALKVLVAGALPTGNVDANRSSAATAAETAVFANLIPRTHVGDDALPRFQATNEDERDDERLARVELIGVAVAGPIVAEILTRLLDKFSPTEDEIRDLLVASPHVTTGAASSLARGLLHYGRGDFEASAAVSTPRIETLARCWLADEPIFRVQRQSTRGQYPQLGALLGAIKSRSDPSWHRFMWTFLVSPFGVNYRNELLHGFIDDVGKVEAALTLQIALYLALTTPSRETSAATAQT